MSNYKNDFCLSDLAPFLQNPQILNWIELHDSIPSTNTRAKVLADSGAVQGTTVIAKSQSAGRGRMGRKFFSPESSGIYLSMIFRPPVHSLLTQNLTALAAVVVSRCVQHILNVDLGIKWVNDLYLDGKKVGGILCEGVFHPDGSGLNYLVLGIGLNLYPPINGFPPELESIASTILSTQPEDSTPLLQLMGALVEDLTLLCDQPDYHSCIEEYKRRSILIGKTVVLHSSRGDTFGVVKNFTDCGHLILSLPDGQEKIISSGEISLRVIKEEKDGESCI